MPFEYLEGIAAADLAYRAWDESLETMNIVAADALMQVMVHELETIEHKDQRTFVFENIAEDMFLYQNCMQPVNDDQRVKHFLSLDP
jgi:SHS2 domain-containing protein